MGAFSLLLSTMAIGALAFFARTAVLLGKEPGGIDAWYYLAYARAFRKKPGFKVRLPQYLLQDLEQSYAPVFPSLLGLAPEKLLARSYWAVAPAIDCLTLLLLILLALKLTALPTVALLAALAYALSPALVSEARALTSRSLGVFLHALSLILAIRAVMGSAHWIWTSGAVLIGALVFLSSATAMAAYVFVIVTLGLAFSEPGFAVIGVLSLALAWGLSRGHLGKVLANYAHAVRFWVTNRSRFGSHPILDSPLYGGPRETVSIRPKELGFMGRGLGRQMLRLVGENPLILALPLAPKMEGLWPSALFVWAAALSLFAVVATVVWPLRAFGPGRNYLKTAIFPTAYVLAAAVGTPARLLRPIGLVTLVALAASLASVAFFIVYMRRKKDELTAHLPPGLHTIAEQLAALPAGGVVCLPGGYSDYIAYRTERAVLWGSHGGSLEKFQLVSPVWKERVEDAARRFGVRYLIVEHAYVDPKILRLDSRCSLIAQEQGFDLFDLQALPAAA